MKRIIVMMLIPMMLLGCGRTETSQNGGEAFSTEEAEVSHSAYSISESTALSTDNDADENNADVEDETVMEEIIIPDMDITKKDLPDNEAIAFVEAMKLGYNLGNTFDSYVDGSQMADLSYETAWGNPKTTQEFIKAVHAAGFETIRIPVSWHNHVDEDFNINEEWMERVQEVVDMAINDGMYVIINIHHDNHLEANGFYPDDDHKDQSLEYVEKIWSQIADRFKEYDDKLIFEALNEPRLVGHDNEWWIDETNSDCISAIAIINELNQKFVDVVRASGGQNASRYLMCPGYCASPEGVLNEGFVIPTDTEENKIILSIHAYRPYSFALESPGTDTFDLNSSESVSEVDSFMSSIYNKYVSKGIPVVIGECGCVDKNGNLRDRVNWAAFYTATAKSYGLTQCMWDNGQFSGDGELFGLFNRTDNTVVFPDIINALVKYSE
ncbi:MAG: glycoside hydrolase family 5 protein [Butyrivibrio sp.]|nr:glycoside hydrolase family 5 protein [Butyrivibrio sp.]